jgi:nitric oxide reductase subunit B
MEYGSIFGHGAYLGPDYTADYLRRSALFVRDRLGGERPDVAQARTIADFKANRYEGGSGNLTFTTEQAAAFEQLRREYSAFFSEPTSRYGLRPGAITDPQELH